METETDYTKYIPTHSKRLTVYQKFYKLLKNTIDSNRYEECKNYNENDIIKMSLNLERGIFNYVLEKTCNKTENIWNDKFRTNYVHRCVTIYTNLDPDSYIKNFSLMKRLLSKELDEFKLTYLSESEIFPERRTQYIMKYEKELLKDLPVEKEHEDGILQCRKCKSFKTEYNEVMTRSADEPTTKLCYCWSCGNRWRFC